MGTGGVSLLKKSASFVNINESGAPSIDTAKLAEESKKKLL
jgi:hypothetical protein